MIAPCIKLSNIRYVSRVKWSNPGKGVSPSSTPRCSSYWKESLLAALDYGRHLYLFDKKMISIFLKHLKYTIWNRQKIFLFIYNFKTKTYYWFIYMKLLGFEQRSSSSSSCRAASTDIPNHLSPLLPIIHHLRQVFRVTSCVFT